MFESPPENVEENVAKTTKAGAKRKFSVQEDEDKTASKPDAFRFSRRATSASETEASNEEGRPSSLERPALAASKLHSDRIVRSELTSVEPVNTDPVVSPKKQRPNALEKPEKHAVPVLKARGRPRLNISRTITPPELPILPIPERVQTAEIHLEAQPPQTPAVEDIFSPPSTEPSTSRPESKDTPPPGDLSAADQIGAGRPGRRARPQVSYKEPSLHTKMRRPDAKLVDAIVGRRTSVEPQVAPSTSGKPSVEREPSEQLGWRPVSAISGRPREEEAEIGSPLRQKLDRRDTDNESKSSPASETVEVKVSTASKAISALISETSTAKRKPAVPASNASKSTVEPPKTKPSTAKQEDNLAIFDFTDSSPADTTTNPRTRITELAKAARNARRHSTISSSVPPETTLHKRTGSGNVKSSSTTSLGKSVTGSAAARSVSLKEKKGLPPSSSSIDLKAKADEIGERPEGKIEARELNALRAERAATRRKSMML